MATKVLTRIGVQGVCVLEADKKLRTRWQLLWFKIFKSQRGSYLGGTCVCAANVHVHAPLNTVQGQHRWEPSSTEAPLYVNPKVHSSASPQTFSTQPHIWIHERALKRTCRPACLYNVRKWVRRGSGHAHQLLSPFFFFLFHTPYNSRLPPPLLSVGSMSWHFGSWNDVTVNSDMSEFADTDAYIRIHQTGDQPGRPCPCWVFSESAWITSSSTSSFKLQTKVYETEIA